MLVSALVLRLLRRSQNRKAHCRCQGGRRLLQKRSPTDTVVACPVLMLCHTASSVVKSRCNPSPHMPMRPMGHSRFIERPISRTTLHVIPSPFRQASCEYLHSQGMHVQDHFEVIENTGEWRSLRRCGFCEIGGTKEFGESLDD